MHNWLHYPSSNWYKIDQKMRFWIWHSTMAQSDGTEKKRNIMHNYTTYYLLYTTPQLPKNILENLLPIWLLMRANCVRSEPFLDSRYEVWQLLLALYSKMRKKHLYRCTFTFLAVKYCGGFFFTKCCAQTCLPIFELFTISQFLTAISRKEPNEYQATSRATNNTANANLLPLGILIHASDVVAGC